jgi:TolB-like protein
LSQGNEPGEEDGAGTSSPEVRRDPSRGGAVFISYASQDAHAALRICNALRAAGIEVWFDQSELRGGDVWDRKIRSQIRDCSLFIPIISTHSEARLEGYFRREWKLAADRTQDMADQKPFLVPVVIDGTAERGASTPEKFHEVQWSRLPGGTTAPAFIRHIEGLLAQTTSAYSALFAEAGTGRPPFAAASKTLSNPTALRRFPRALMLIGACAVVVLAYVLIDRIVLSKRPADTGRIAVSASASNSPTQPEISEKSIAVLPFLDMSEKHDQEYFSDGLAEELLDLLSKTPGLRVIARTSSFYFKGKQVSLPEIAKTLNVANLLEGSVRRAGNRLRVTTQLIRADTGEHLWSESYDRDLKDVFQVQDDIAAAVVKALRTTLLLSNPENRTKNMEAYTLFLQGRSLAKASATDQREATQLLRRAVELDPSYSSAWAELANVLYELSAFIDSGQDVDADMESARSAVQRALEIDPGNASAHYLRATIRIVHDHDPKGAIADIDAARRSDPHLTKPTELVLVAGCISGPCFEQYIREISRDIELDPLNANIIQTRGWAYWIAGNSIVSRSSPSPGAEPGIRHSQLPDCLYSVGGAPSSGGADSGAS